MFCIQTLYASFRNIEETIRRVTYSTYAKSCIIHCKYESAVTNIIYLLICLICKYALN